METKILTKFTSKLVIAICDCVQSVAGKCSSEGIVPDSVYASIINTTGGQTNMDKARVLVEAVKNSVAVDTTGSCCQLFLNALDEELPYAVKGSLLVPLKEEVSKTSQECQSVVPFRARSAESLALITNDEMVRQQTSFFGRLEDAIRKHERVCSEKAQLEENIKLKEQENEDLKAELNILKRVDGAKSIEQLESTVNRIAACETDVSELREKVKKLESIIDEQNMLIKRGRSTMKQGLMTLSHLAKKEITSAKESAEKKETEYKIQEEALKMEKRKVEEELRAKIQALEHKVALQEKDLQIKDLEINYQRQVPQLRSETETHQQQDEASSAPAIRPFSIDPGYVTLQVDPPQSKKAKVEDRDHPVLPPSLLPPPSPRNRLTSRHHTALLDQLENHAARWRDIGASLDFRPSELEDIQVYPVSSLGAPKSYLSRLLSKWLEWAPGDGRGSEGFATLERLKDALRQINLGATAHDLKL